MTGFLFLLTMKFLIYHHKVKLMTQSHFKIIIIGLICLSGCADPANHELKLSGTVEMTEYSLGTQAAGRLMNVAVDEGDKVTKGQLIATLDHYEQAKKDWERGEQLIPTGALSEQEVEHLKQDMNDHQVVSPIDGVVLIKVHEEGEIVSPGAPVVVIGEPDDMWVRVFIPENKIAQIKMKQQIPVRIDGVESEILGEVDYISPKAEFTPRNVQTPEERATQTFAVKIKIHKTDFIHPGISADVYL